MKVNSARTGHHVVHLRGVANATALHCRQDNYVVVGGGKGMLSFDSWFANRGLSGTAVSDYE